MSVTHEQILAIHNILFSNNEDETLSSYDSIKRFAEDLISSYSDLKKDSSIEKRAKFPPPPDDWLTRGCSIDPSFDPWVEALGKQVLGFNAIPENNELILSEENIILDIDAFEESLNSFEENQLSLSEALKRKEEFVRMFRNVEQDNGIFSKVYIVQGNDSQRVCENKEEADVLCSACNQFQSLHPEFTHRFCTNWSKEKTNKHLEINDALNKQHPLGMFSESDYRVIESDYQIAKTTNQEELCCYGVYRNIPHEGSFLIKIFASEETAEAWIEAGRLFQEKNPLPNAPKFSLKEIEDPTFVFSERPEFIDYISKKEELESKNPGLYLDKGESFFVKKLVIN